MIHARYLIAASVLAAAGFAAAPVSQAQAADLSGGKPVPGVCLLSREAVFAQSKVGQAANDRLRQLAQQVHGQLDTERKPLASSIQSYQQKQGSLSEAERKKEGTALQDRMQMFQAQVHSTDERVQLTREKVLQRIGADAQPIVASAYTSHHCGLLLNRDAVLGGNLSNDLTSDVVQGLDRKITTISFGLEPLPSSAQKQGAGGK